MSRRRPENRPPEAPNAGQFKPGTSGNPGGRPKAVRELLERARASVPKALAFAEGLLDDDKADLRVRLDAAKFITTYGLGAPPRQLEDDEADPDVERSVLDEISPEALRFVARGGLQVVADLGVSWETLREAAAAAGARGDVTMALQLGAIAGARSEDSEHGH